MFENYIKRTIKKKYRKEYELLEQQNNQSNFETQILNLRALKFARLLINKIEEETARDDFKIFVTIKIKVVKRNKSIVAEYQIIGDAESNNIFKTYQRNYSQASFVKI